jgi:hypothetical protein
MIAGRCAYLARQELVEKPRFGAVPEHVRRHHTVHETVLRRPEVAQAQEESDGAGHDHS